METRESVLECQFLTIMVKAGINECWFWINEWQKMMERKTCHGDAWLFSCLPIILNFNGRTPVPASGAPPTIIPTPAIM